MAAAPGQHRDQLLFRLCSATARPVALSRASKASKTAASARGGTVTAAGPTTGFTDAIATVLAPLLASPQPQTSLRQHAAELPLLQACGRQLSP